MLATLSGKRHSSRTSKEPKLEVKAQVIKTKFNKNLSGDVHSDCEGSPQGCGSEAGTLCHTAGAGCLGPPPQTALCREGVQHRFWLE